MALDVAALLVLLLVVPCAVSDPRTTSSYWDTTTPVFYDTTETPVVSPTRWPNGRFSLVMAYDSCPDFANFKQGLRTQDTENDDNMNTKPRNPGMLGPIDNSVFTFRFCTVVNDDFGSYAWPKGSYCIHKKGFSCPPGGFSEGSIIFDDEDDGNKNKRRGVLPEGWFHFDTRYYFCCRDDGNPLVPISLPTSKPFYLYKFNGPCQKVRGMVVEEEVYGIDTENDYNVDKVSPYSPFKARDGASSYVRLRLCLYVPKSW